ncbi:hypothetical protein CRYUN_Cryun06bG0127700 [Craigia yunnanensis]
MIMRNTNFREPSKTHLVPKPERASTPPRGWNSYDSFCWIISEEEFLQNAELVSNRLKPHGYQYVVVDYLWYRRKVEGANTDSLGFDLIDEWGRPIPDPERWPSSKGGKGFSEVAKKVHSMGLKFGIHVMRGISLQAFNANTPILDIVKGSAYEESGRQWMAKDIGLKERTCAWMSHGFMSVNTKLEAGRAFLRSLYLQFAEWGVDFVKNDCVFGDDLDIDEITFVSEILRKLDRPILYSLSPGGNASPAMAKGVSGLVNMYRITGDDWDTWKDVVFHFDVTRNFSASKMIGAKGLLGRSWPDLDMLPFGWLTDPGSTEGPHRSCNLTLDEQRTQMTLWAIAKSPLMFGGDVRKLDKTTYNLITNPTLLGINSFSSNNMEFPYITGTKGSRSSQDLAEADVGSNGICSWIATGKKGEIYLAFFNLNSEKTVISANVADLAKVLPRKDLNNGASCKYREIWSGKFGVTKQLISIAVEKHSSTLFVLHCY